MNKNELLDLFENLDTKIIEEADTTITKKKVNWIRITSIAASLFVVVGIVILMNSFSKDKTNVTGIVSKENLGNATVYTDTEGSKVSSNNGIYVPSIELPTNADGVAMDMIGLVVYNGGIYTQSYDYRGEEAVNIVDNLLGDYLGYATGTIDEWATQEAYSTEFASTYEGEVYAVEGYDTSFRICVKWEAMNETSDSILVVVILDRLNGITLETGSDLFEDRLHISGHIASIEWQSHEDWDYAKNNFQLANIDEELWSNFISKLDSGSFVYMWDSNNPSNNIYDTDNQAHIILTMNDGTRINLRLIEGGYVGLDGFYWYFVRIPEEEFNEVFKLCGGEVVD